jgi:hypothetical protein
METLVLLARETALPAEVDLAGLLGDLGPQTATDEWAVAWFENGQVVTGEKDRAANLKAVEQGSSPVLRTQALLRQRLGKLFRYTRAVTFANRGGP